MEVITRCTKVKRGFQEDFKVAYMESFYHRPFQDCGWEEFKEESIDGKMESLTAWIQRINQKEIWIEELISIYTQYEMDPIAQELTNIIVFTPDSKIEDLSSLREGNEEDYDELFDDGIDQVECPYEIHLIGLSVKKLIINESY